MAAAVFCLIGAMFAAGFASCLPKTWGWPLPTGLGGVIGDAILRAPAWVFGPLNGVELLVAAAVFGVVLRSPR